MSEPVIKVSGVSLAYKLYEKPIDQLKEMIFGGVRHDTFWALRNVNLIVHEGEKLGIIGPNGAGKSSLLKLITGTTLATEGSISTNGRISSLLSMVPAWNNDDNGIDNIKFNLLLNGVEETKIPAMIEEIADFTELGSFLYRPVKTYSTGMGARLSFAIATATQPDILIIDEVLGTGDGYFAAKAKKRMDDFCARGRALILVSHSIAAIQSMCDRVIWMQNGGIRLDGASAEVLGAYELDYRRVEDEATRPGNVKMGDEENPSITELTDGSHVRFRIVPTSGSAFVSSHYIYDIRIQIDDGKWISLPLEFSESSAVACLDILASEWARLHEKSGRQCRVLTHIPGRNKGGQFVASIADGPQKISIIIEYNSTDSSEGLSIEYLDMEKGAWCPLTLSGTGPLLSARAISAYVVLGKTSPTNMAEVVAKTIEAASPAVEILSVAIVVAGCQTSSLVENQGFEIQVCVFFRRPPQMADVGIKITRMDGTYIFWQSSGEVNGNLVNPNGTYLLKFKFSENFIGAGEYYLNVHVTNGWRYPENYPYSEVYARRVNSTRFLIHPEQRGLDRGILNKVVEVEIVESE